MKERIFEGVGTALITPFKNEKIDYKTFEALIERQIDAGVAALVIGGTTGEAATLTVGERDDLYRAAREIIGERVKLIFGTGSNDTKRAIEYTEKACTIGCDGVLVVTPYYNKGTNEGLVRHYEKIAERSDAPVLLYNVPSRTGVSLSTDLLRRLSENEKIVGIKEASDSADRLVELSLLSPDLTLYSGNDSLTYTTLALGGAGVISVISNLYPEDMVELCKQFFTKNENKALEIQKRLLPVLNSMFIETNPAPIKYAMSRAGLSRPDMRLPLWLPTPQSRKKIDRAILEYNERSK